MFQKKWFHRLFSSLLSIVLFYQPAVAQQESAVRPPHEFGTYSVRSLDFPDLRDGRRNGQPVPMKVFYPEGAGLFPLVIMSHGAVGTWNAMPYQAEHVASHGYVVVCPEHVSSSNKMLQFYRSDAGGDKTIMEAVHAMLRDPRARLERPRDISFCIDQAEIWNASHPTLKNRINSRKVAVMGHSYGAYTTLLVCGARTILDTIDLRGVPAGQGLGPDLSDKRVTFGLAMSPQGPGLFFNKESFRTVDRPLVLLSGTKDEQEAIEPGNPLPATTRLSLFDLLPPGDKYFLWLENADHLSFAHNKATLFLPSLARKDVQRISKAMMVLFCDYFLKDKKELRQQINWQYANSLTGLVVRKIDWYEK